MCVRAYVPIANCPASGVICVCVRVRTHTHTHLVLETRGGGGGARTAGRTTSVKTKTRSEGTVLVTETNSHTHTHTHTHNIRNKQGTGQGGLNVLSLVRCSRQPQNDHCPCATSNVCAWCPADDFTLAPCTCCICGSVCCPWESECCLWQCCVSGGAFNTLSSFPRGVSCHLRTILPVPGAHAAPTPASKVALDPAPPWALPTSSML